MTGQPGRVRVGLQRSGRLAERSLELLRDAGLRLQRGSNDLMVGVENYPVDVLRVRDDDIPTFVADGVCALGVVGLNVLAEHAAAGDQAAPAEVMRLGFGRCSLKIAVPQAFDWTGPASLKDLRIATSYPALLRQWLAAEGVRAEVVTLTGSVEVAPRLRIAHAICDLVSTGATLESNALTAVATVLDSEAVLVRGPPGADTAAEHLVDLLVERLRGVTASEGAKYILLNAPRAALPAITDVLPGANAPTVTPLAGRDDVVAVHAVCQESVFWETLERLKAVGASAILVMPIEKMML